MLIVDEVDDDIEIADDAVGSLTVEGNVSVESVIIVATGVNESVVGDASLIDDAAVDIGVNDDELLPVDPAVD